MKYLTLIFLLLVVIAFGDTEHTEHGGQKMIHLMLQGNIFGIGIVQSGPMW